ncbi:MAG: WD40 repeat domain-containing protein [Terriglobia bacterium]
MRLTDLGPFRARWLILILSVGVLALPVTGHILKAAQVETIPAGPAAFVWQHRLQIQGHLALNYSPAGAFSQDSSTLAVVEGARVVLANLADGRVRKVLHPRFANVSNLIIQSANFVSPASLFMLASGLAQSRSHSAAAAPELAFQWDAVRDTLAGKVEQVGAGGGFLPARYFPRIGYLVLCKGGTFDVWNPVTARGGRVTLPELKNPPHLFQFSPDGHWLILAQIEANASPNPIVVLLQTHRFTDVLGGHGGPVLSIAFSRDSSKVATACADGKVRIFAAPGWKLLRTLTGNAGAARWVDFSPGGDWIASAGQDGAVRIWSVQSGRLVQTLSESREPLATLAFSPDGRYLVASSDRMVHVWFGSAIN